MSLLHPQESFFRALARAVALAGVASVAGTLTAAASAQTRLVTVNRNGTGTANNGSGAYAFSADGRFMVFVSTASDLLATDTPGQNVYVRDLANGTTTLVSVDHAGNGGANYQCFNPVISADGRYVAFESTASNLVPNDTNAGYSWSGHLSDVFVRDLQLGVTTLVSVNKAGTDSGEDGSYLPSITPDGSLVAFYSSAKSLVSNPPTPCGAHPSYETNVYVRHLPYGPTELVSVSGAQNHACGESYSYLPPAISADGRYVAFTSGAGDLAPNDTNLMEDVFVRDLQAQTTTLVSVNPSGNTGAWQLNNRSEYAFMSADGRYVVFTSYVPDLVGNDTNGPKRDVFVRDLVAHETHLVSVTSSGGSGNGDSFTQAITPDGRFVAFYSLASDMVAGISDTNATQDAFVRDLENQTTTLVSVNQDGTGTGNGQSLFGGLSADGRIAAWVSNASDLVAGDGNGNFDVFVRDLQGGATSLVSINAAATGSGNDYSFIPIVSPDGSRVAFTSTATNLVQLPDLNGSAEDVFIRTVVPTPQEALANLIQLLQSFALPKGLENSLSSKLQNAQKSLDKGNTTAACGQIEAFINQVAAQSGKGLTSQQASQLTIGAVEIRTALGCS